DAGRAVERMHRDDAWRGTAGREARVGRREQALTTALADEGVEVCLVLVRIRVRVAVALRRAVYRSGQRLIREVEVGAPVGVSNDDAALLVHRRVVEVEQVATRVRPAAAPDAAALHRIARR